MKDRLNEGETLFAEGKIEAAKELFLDLFQEDPQNPEVSNNLGVVYHALGDLKKAEEYFRKSLSLRDDDSDCLRNLADLYNAQKRWQEASEYLEKSVSVQDNDPHIYNQLATVYLELGEVQKAKAALGESLRIDGDQEIIKESLKEVKKAEASSETCQESGFFKAAFVEVDITPQVSEQYPILLQGFSGSPRKATDKSTSLMMQLLLLEDHHFTKFLIVSADIFGFGSEIVERVRLAAKNWGIEPEGIILNASHTHYAPGTISHAAKSLGPFYNQYAEHICKSITEQLPCLYERLEACDLFSGKTDVQIGVNRRLEKDGEIIFAPNNAGYYETHTPFLLVHLKNSKEKIVLINHGCHPSGSEMESRISGDFPAYMRNRLSQNGLVKGVMFLQGAAGSSKQIGSAGEGNLFGENENIDRENGETLATQISKALESELEPVEGFFFGVRKTVALPLKPLPDAVEIQTIRDNSDSIQLTREWAANLLKRYPSGNFPTRIEMELQSVSIGEGIIFLSIPGEPVAELAKELIPLTHNPDGTFILGYTNGLMAYIPTDRMINELGYETDFSLFAYLLPSAFDRGTESAVITTAKACIEDIHRKDVPNGYGRYHLAKGKNEAFFVLSAGRCGTMTLAHLLDTAANASVWHHPQPDPIKESLLAYWNSIDNRSAFWKVRQPVIHKTWAEGLIHGETDILMTPFCDMIAKEIPNSKFIVLVRNPWDFIRSGMRRNYYYGHPWDFGRLRPRDGSSEKDDWNRRDQFEKICWLWRETHERIVKIINEISPDRVATVRFEDLVDGPGKTEELFRFLNLAGFDASRINVVLGQRFNAQQTGEFPKVGDWPENLIVKMREECGVLAERFGYSLPSESAHSRNRPSSQSIKPCITEEEGPRILFLELPNASTGGHLDHIVEYFGNITPVKYIKSLEQEEIRNAVDWSDVVWLEWADGMAIHVTHNVPEIKKKKVICRLNGWEVFTDMPAKINWPMVDHLLFGAHHKQALCNRKFKIPSSAQSVIRYGVDFSKFTIPEDKRNTKRLVFLGHLNFRKGLPQLLQFYHELLKRDSDYYLYIRGEFQNSQLEMSTHTMIRELVLGEKLEFVDWVDNLNLWLTDKSHILSFSLEESFHYAVGNGMAAGLKPVIHAWKESRDIWPEEFIFNDLDGFLKIMLDQSYEPMSYREMICDSGLDAGRQINEIKALIEDLTGRKIDPGGKLNVRPANDSPVKKNATPLSIVNKQVLKDRGNIYIIGLKRSGTTIFWETFRQDKRFVCFDEPFHPRLRAHLENGLNNKKKTMNEFLARPDLVRSHWSAIPPHDELFPEFLGHQVAYLNALSKISTHICVDFVRCHSKIRHLKKIDPKGLIIHLVRDPRAFATSHLKPYGKWISSDIPDHFFEYDGWFDFWQYQSLANELGLKGFAHEKLLQLWKHFTDLAESQNPDLTVKFEDFAADPEKVVRDIFKKIDLEYIPLDYSRIHPPHKPFRIDDERWHQSIERYGLDRQFICSDYLKTEKIT